MSDALLFAGLGNYERKYLKNRHNVGFMAIDIFAQDENITLNYKEKFKAEMGEGIIAGRKIILVKPYTFMNLSGQSVQKVLKFHNLTPEQLVVLHDELDFPFGKIALKKGGGHAGHNGLRSVIAETQSRDFKRIRIGIGKPAVKELIVPHVLSDFSSTEMKSLKKDILPQVEEHLRCLVNT